MNVGKKEKTLEQDKEVTKEVEYAEEFHHTPASEATYDIPFPSDEDIPKEVLEYEETFLEQEQLPIPLETEQNQPFPQEVLEGEDMNLVRWAANQTWSVALLVMGEPTVVVFNQNNISYYSFIIIYFEREI